MEKARVWFSAGLDSDTVVRLYDAVGRQLPGRVAVKVHSGEKGNINFLRPEFWKPVIDHVGGRVVETNTNYNGERNTTEKHRAVLEYHGWSHYFDVDIMDEDGELALPVKEPLQISENLVGKNLMNYDSMLVLIHFKGHPRAGYGGALKQLSIGCASKNGKAVLHTGGIPGVKIWSPEAIANQEAFQRAMADAAYTVAEHFKDKLVYIAVMRNISVDCDCLAKAEPPCMKDIGILASLDPIALDTACFDLIYAAKDDPGQGHFLERVRSKNGDHLIDLALEHGFGTKEYELIDIDKA